MAKSKKVNADGLFEELATGSYLKGEQATNERQEADERQTNERQTADNMERYNVRFSPRMWDRLKSEAQRRSVSTSALLRMIVSEWLE